MVPFNGLSRGRALDMELCGGTEGDTPPSGIGAFRGLGFSQRETVKQRWSRERGTQPSGGHRGGLGRGGAWTTTARGRGVSGH